MSKWILRLHGPKVKMKTNAIFPQNYDCCHFLTMSYIYSHVLCLTIYNVVSLYSHYAVRVCIMFMITYINVIFIDL